MRRSKIAKLLRMLNWKRRTQWTMGSLIDVKRENVVPGRRKWNRKFLKENINHSCSSCVSPSSYQRQAPGCSGRDKDEIPVALLVETQMKILKAKLGYAEERCTQRERGSRTTEAAVAHRPPELLHGTTEIG